MTQSPGAKRTINLIRGWPSPRVLPAGLLRAAATAALSDADVFVPGLQYAPDPGFQPLREELSRFLARYYGSPEVDDPRRLCITGGASQNLACLLSSFTDPAFTRRVWVLAPCYHLACPIFEDAGFRGRLRAVPQDDEGIDLAWLESAIRSVDGGERGRDGDEQRPPPAAPVFKDLTGRKAYRHVIYVVPTSSNPSGNTMSIRRREGLVRLAREHDALVICDDVYDFLQWPVPTPASTGSTATATGSAGIVSDAESEDPTAPLLPRVTPPPRLVDIERELTARLGPSRHDGGGFGHAVSNGSFSKIIAPGVRTGWAEGTPAFAAGLAATGSNRSGGAASQLSAVLVWEMMRSGALAAHIDGLVRPDLQRRHATLLDALRTHLAGLDVDFVGAKAETAAGATTTYGGYFLWLTLGGGDGVSGAAAPSADLIARRALRDENLIVAAGSMFQVAGDREAVKFRHNLRLCFSWEEEDDIIEGVRRLGRVLRGLRDNPPTAEELRRDEEESREVFGFV